MNALEIYVAVVVTLLFMTGVGLLITDRRKARRIRKQWDGRA
jgi:hypothetical protein